MQEKTFEIIKHIGVLGEKGEWKLEVNEVKFFDNPPKIDIRRWNEDHTKMSKGISLSKAEFEELKRLLAEF